MSIIEVQFAAAAFLRAKTQELLRLHFCPPKPIVFAGESVQLQRVSFGANQFRHNVADEFTIFWRSTYHNPEPPHLYPTPYSAKGFRTHLAQDMILDLTLSSLIDQHVNAAAPIIASIPLTAIFELRYLSYEGDGCQFVSSLHDVEYSSAAFSGLPPGLDVQALKQALRKGIADAMGPTSRPFNFAEVLPGGSGTIVNAGLSMDAGLQRLVFRTDNAPGSDSNDRAWTPFYTGHIPDRLGGNDWSAFVAGVGLAQTVNTALERALKTASVPALRISSIGSEYSNQAGTPTITTYIHAFLDVPVLPTRYLVPRIVTTYGFDATDGSLVVDLFLTDLEDLIKEYQNFFGAMKTFSPMLWAIIDLIAGDDISKLGTALDSITPPASAGQSFIKVSSSHFRARIQPRVGEIDSSLRLKGVLALEDGMSMVGSITTLQFKPSELVAKVSNFAWVPPRVSCGSVSRSVLDEMRRNPRAMANLYAEIEFTQTGSAPIYICGVEAVDERPGQPGSLPAYVFPTMEPGLRLEGDRAPTKVTVLMKAPNADYEANPYDLVLLVRTSVGVRKFRFPPPPPITDKVIKFLVGSLEVQLMLCERVLPSWFEERDQFSLDWIEDPLLDPDFLGAPSFYGVEVTGLAAGEQVSIINSAGNPVMTGLAAQGQALRLTALAATDEKLTLARRVTVERLSSSSASRSNAMAQTGQGIQVYRQRLKPAAAINLPNACRQLLSTTLGNRNGVAALVDDTILLYDLSQPGSPALLGRWVLPGAIGMRALDGSLLVFADDRFAMLDAQLRLHLHAGPVECGTIIDVAIGRHEIFVLTDRGLEIRSASLRCRQHLPVEGGQCIVRVSDRLLIGAASGISVLDISNERRPRPLATLKDFVARQFTAAPAAPLTSVVASLHDGSSVLLECKDAEPTVLAEYAVRPWFAMTALIGDLLVHARHGDSRLRIFRVGAAAAARPRPVECAVSA